MDYCKKNINNYEYLYNGLKNIENITLFENKKYRENSRWLFTMRVNKKHEFIENMKEYGITTS